MLHQAKAELEGIFSKKVDGKVLQRYQLSALADFQIATLRDIGGDESDQDDCDHHRDDAATPGRNSCLAPVVERRRLGKGVKFAGKAHSKVFIDPKQLSSCLNTAPH